MKELLKVVAKRLFIWSIIINTVYSLADYGQAFVLSHFGTSPLTQAKCVMKYKKNMVFWLLQQ